MTILAPAPTRTPPASLTPEELLSLPDAVGFELVDGKLVERHMGMESSAIAGNIYLSLGNFVKEHRLGHTFPADASYHCFPDGPIDVRKPDVSFIRIGRLPGERIPKGHCPIPPDLAVEVVSPNDSAYELEEKIEQYLSVNIPLIWVVYPPSRIVRIFRPGASPLGDSFALKAGDTITGEGVIPGFSCPVAAFFE
ncbi:MAG TPA: Uma2 family endonuclease [Humisphaera sp.]|nr:Uma2 family endonuclease [Humisphaera sp.]